MSENYSSLLGYIQKKKIKRILLISFEDAEIIKKLKESFSGELKVLTKTDFVGTGLNEIIQKTRNSKYDLVVVSNINSHVNRSKTSIKILTILSKSFKSFVYFDEKDFLKTNKIKLLLDLCPRLLIGILFSIYILIKTYLYFYLIYPFTGENEQKRKNQNRLILYLRTDLAGKIIAGGSITHIRGFIDGAKKLDFETIYVADYPLIDHSISIVVKPNSLLDFFDEIQMMDYHFRLIKKLRKCLKGIQIGIIYQRHSIFNASGVILSKILEVPVILEVNNSEVWAKKNWSRLIFENLATRIEKFAFEKADIISVVSEVTKEQIINIGANEKKIVVNPNGVDPEKFSPDINGNEIRIKYKLDEFFVVGFIGTFSRWHGVETLFDAAVKVLSKNDKIRFLLIGDGNLKSNLELKAEQLNLKDKIIFTGIVSHDKAPEYLAACDILVSPHLGFETGERFFGSPTKLFEYMAMGKPIIASELEQIGKIIENEFNGLKFKPGYSQELSELILRLYEDRELCKRLGQQAREDVIRSFTWEKNARRVLERIYNF
ncbi:MAG: glycosyltransferase family 4 protein [Ignavibacteria bacterium]